MAASGYRKWEPQINADERNNHVTDFIGFLCCKSFLVMELGAIHRKGRKERKAQPQFRTRMTRIGRIFTDMLISTSSEFHHVCSSLKSPASDASVSAFIRVHLRFFIDVIFQTGLTGFTGYVFNPVHPVILPNLKYQPTEPEKSTKVWEGG